MKTDTISRNKVSRAINLDLLGLSLPMALILTAVMLLAIWQGVLPKGMIGAFVFIMIVGIWLNALGDNLPIFKQYLGGGPMILIFGTAAMATYGIIPSEILDNVSSFMKGQGFLNFYIAALICGSILGMSKQFLISAALRYLPVILGGVILSLVGVGLIGFLIGFGFREAVFYIGIPIMGGGMGAGAVPLSQIFATALNEDPAIVLSKMVPAVAMANALAIVIAGLLNRLGKIRPGLSGNGRLLRIQKADTAIDNVVEEKPHLTELTIGLLIATTLYSGAQFLGVYIKIHPYALLIITVGLIKVLGIMPEYYEQCCAQWFRFIMTSFTAALLVGIGIAYTNLAAVIDVLSFTYILLVLVVLVVLLGAVVGSALVGHFFKFFPIEASITAGLCMANMGGTGDVAVLSASHRMGLMPFAQISSRIGGAFMLILANAALAIL